MSKLYTDSQRQLQDEFDTRKMADRIEELAFSEEVIEPYRGFIESRDMFFLATVDSNGSPTVSYKGGDVGVVKVLDEKTVMFPSYDGNGMFLSMGNIDANPEIGILFIDFEKPHRVRLQGTASLSRDPELVGQYKEADLVVKVHVNALFQNCPRYIHRYQRVEQSRYVPKTECETPMATWKRVDIMQDVLPERDVAKVREGGEEIIGIEEWFEKVATGAPDA